MGPGQSAMHQMQMAQLQPGIGTFINNTAMENLRYAQLAMQARVGISQPGTHSISIQYSFSFDWLFTDLYFCCE